MRSIRPALLCVLLIGLVAGGATPAAAATGSDQGAATYVLPTTADKLLRLTPANLTAVVPGAQIIFAAPAGIDFGPATVKARVYLREDTLSERTLPTNVSESGRALSVTVPSDAPSGGYVEVNVTGVTAPGYSAWAFDRGFHGGASIEAGGATQTRRELTLHARFHDHEQQVFAAGRPVSFALPEGDAALAQLEAASGVPARFTAGAALVGAAGEGIGTPASGPPLTPSADGRSVTGTLPTQAAQGGPDRLRFGPATTEPAAARLVLSFEYDKATLDQTSQALPATPTDVVASAGPASAAVAWTDPDGGVGVHTVTSSPGGFTCRTLTTGCTVGRLVPGTAYAFTVTTTNGLGSSAPSSPSASVTPVGVPASRFVPLSPVRLLDTRNGTGAPVGSVGPGGVARVKVTGVAGIPAEGVTAVALNLTAVFPSRSTFVSAYPTGSARPVASNLNPAAGSIVPNAVVVKVGDLGRIDLYNETGSTDLLVDVAGYFVDDPSGSTYRPLSPTRMLDTRNGTGGPAGVIGAGQTRSLQVTGAAGVPAAGVTAVALNVTAVIPSRSTFVTAYPTGSARPVASNLNPAAGSIVPNFVVVKVGDLGRIDLYNETGSTDLLADIAGYYTDDPAGSTFRPLNPTRVVDTRTGLGRDGRPGPLGESVYNDLQITGVAGIPTTGVSAVVLNVTAVLPTKDTFVSVLPDGFPLRTSNLNPPAGSIVPNLVVVKVSDLGKVRFYNKAGDTHLLADVSGYYTTLE